MNLLQLAKVCDLGQNKLSFTVSHYRLCLCQHHGNRAAECKRIRRCEYTVAILEGRPKGAETGQNESSHKNGHSERNERKGTRSTKVSQSRIDETSKNLNFAALHLAVRICQWEQYAKPERKK